MASTPPAAATRWSQVELGSEPDSAFAELGWTAVPGGDAHFLVTSLAMATRSAGRDTDVVLEEDGPRVRVVRSIDGREIGSGRGAARRRLAGRARPRGRAASTGARGHATAMMAALLEWGAERGATTVWLHVETDNEPALALYGGLGFRIHHTNRYRLVG